MVAKLKPSRHAPEEIDAYLAPLPDDMRSTLEHLRTIIRETVPDCTERVSYQIPIFRLKKDLVGISAQQNHCALHTMSPALVARMGSELSGVTVSGATIHFKPGVALPGALIEKIIEERMREIRLA